MPAKKKAAAKKKGTSVKKAASKMLDATSAVKRASRRQAINKTMTTEERAQYGKGAMKKGFNERSKWEANEAAESKVARKNLKLNKPKGK